MRSRRQCASKHRATRAPSALSRFARVFTAQELLPAVGAHLEKEMVHPTMYASQWFITLFSYSLPFDVVLRIWDIFMLEARRTPVSPRFRTAGVSHSPSVPSASRAQRRC